MPILRLHWAEAWYPGASRSARTHPRSAAVGALVRRGGRDVDIVISSAFATSPITYGIATEAEVIKPLSLFAFVVPAESEFLVLFLFQNLICAGRALIARSVEVDDVSGRGTLQLRMVGG
jgi:hypothetical protein